MPDYSSDLFFLQTTILTLIGPLFRNNPETTQGAQSGKEAKANLVQTFFKVT